MANTTIEELLNLAYEVRDADQAGENTALRVGGLLEEIIQYLSTVVGLDTLQAILEEYATVTGGGLIYWRHSRIICLASMGYDLDNIDGGNWNYTNFNGDIVFRPSSGGYLNVVGTAGDYSVFQNVVYVNNHTGHAYLWKLVGNTYKMVEIRDSSPTTIITYLNTPPFSQVAVGESYFYTSGSTRKIAIKLSSDEVYSFDPDPKKIYVFLDTKQAMVWDSGNRQWISVGGNLIQIINDLVTGGGDKALSAEMGKRLRVKIDEVQANIQRLYNNLGDIAFWNATSKSAAAPHPINWGGSTYTVALQLILNNAVVKHNGVAKANGESIQVEEGGELTLTVEPSDNTHAFSGAPSASVNGTNINPVINQDGSYTINVPIGQSDVTLIISATAVAARNINVVVKKITAIPSVDNSGTLSVNPPTMTSEVDTNTGCGVTGVENVADGGAYNGIINIASNYGMFSAKMTMGGTDISDKINLANGAINIAAVTGDITITLTVAEAVDGMFLGKSFFDNNGSVNTAYCGTLISGGVPTNANNPNDDWCCNAEFFSVPAGANKIKLVHGPILTAKTDTNNIQNKRGCLIVYNPFGVRVGHITIYNANETERELNFPLLESASSAVSAYVRGSFIKNKLGISKILFSTDGGTTWIDKFDGSEKDITTT